MRIASLNVQGVHQNKIFATELAKNTDILCLQEHWLNNYEENTLKEIFPDRIIHSCSHEVEYNHSRRTSGQGGVATIFSDRVAPYVDPPTQDSNGRILISTINLGETPLLIINCYLASGNSAEALAKFQEDMDAIHITIQKYPRHEVLFIGDLNEDHYHRKSPKENSMINFIKEHQLQDLGEDGKENYSYVNPHLNHQSRIDHALIKSKGTIYKWNQAKIDSKSNSALNTSYHHPLHILVEVQGHKSHIQKKKLTVKTIFDHKSMDQAIFSYTMEQEVKTCNWEWLEPNAAINALQNMVETALIASTPKICFKTSQKKKSSPWFPELALAVKNSKLKLHAWKEAGRPKGQHPTWLEKKEATKYIRKVQRSKAAQERKLFLEELSVATENDPRLAAKLIKRQLKDRATSACLVIDGKTVTDNEEINNAWASYFEELSFNSSLQEEDFQLRLMRKINEACVDGNEFDSQALNTAIKNLKSGKAHDLKGHSAELLKLFPKESRDVLLHIINKILKSGKIPDVLKQAYKIVLPKPNKDPQIMDNYRGITIASILLKTIETLWISSGNEAKINNQISHLQFGFTNARSPSMASLLISESIAMSRANKTPLYIISLDARKAFDVVDHFILRKKIHNTNLPSNMWRMIDDLYVNTTECIRWMKEDSRSYKVQRGVKQGSVVSPLLYKLYINDLLLSFESSDLGMRIGTTFVGSPTCADDITLITEYPEQIQPLLDIAQEYAQNHRYELHPTKSTITCMVHQKRAYNMPDRSWVLGDKDVTISEEFTHLGLNWKSGKNMPDVQANIKKARRAAYMFLRVGLHGNDGIDPPAAHKVIQTYVTPRLLHGLEATVPSSKEIKLMDGFYKRLLRQIQALPENVATEAIYILLGAHPIEIQLHCRTLSLFGSICRLPANHSLRQLATRQLATQSKNKLSWFHHVTYIASKYDIDIFTAIRIPDDKLTWKRKIKSAIYARSTAELVQNVATKSTLKWWIWKDNHNLSTHYLWTGCNGNQSKIASATVRARMLTGRFRTMVECSRYQNKGDGGNPICPLCQEENEDILHLLTRCRAMQHLRNSKVTTLQDMYRDDGKPPPSSDREVCSAILNGSCYLKDAYPINHNNRVINKRNLAINAIYIEDSNIIYRANSLCNSICYMISIRRDTLLNTL